MSAPGTDSGPSRGDPRRRAIRPIATSRGPALQQPVNVERRSSVSEVTSDFAKRLDHTRLVETHLRAANSLDAISQVSERSDPLSGRQWNPMRSCGDRGRPHLGASRRAGAARHGPADDGLMSSTFPINWKLAHCVAAPAFAASDQMSFGRAPRLLSKFAPISNLLLMAVRSDQSPGLRARQNFTQSSIASDFPSNLSRVQRLFSITWT